MSTRVFITGGGGFVGQAVRRIDPAVATVARDAFEDFAAEGGGALLHLAWPGMQASQAEWEVFVARSLALRRACEAAEVAFVGVGSGVEAHLNNGLHEPYLSYARRKAELAARLAPDAWVRLHFLFGEGEAASRLVPAALRACASGEPLACGGLERRRHWASVDEVAAALVAFAREPEAGTVDIAGREAVSFRELLGLVEQATGTRLQVTAPASPPPDDGIPLIAPRSLARNLPAGLGTRPNLLARLTEYAVLIGAMGQDR